MIHNQKILSFRLLYNFKEPAKPFWRIASQELDLRQPDAYILREKYPEGFKTEEVGFGYEHNFGTYTDRLSLIIEDEDWSKVVFVLHTDCNERNSRLTCLHISEISDSTVNLEGVEKLHIGLNLRRGLYADLTIWRLDCTSESLSFHNGQNAVKEALEVLSKPV